LDVWEDIFRGRKLLFLFEVINFGPESIAVEVIHSFEGEKSKPRIFDANAKTIVALVTLMAKSMR
jgi:hypothetical protein